MVKLSFILAVALFFAGCEDVALNQTNERQSDTANALTHAMGPFAVAPGVYKGFGTWSDSTGANGTLTDTTTITVLPNGDLSNTEVATYSDGKVVSLTIIYANKGGSRYDVAVEVNGQQFVIGNGACGPRQCATALNSAAGQFVESTRYTKTPFKTLSREGGFNDPNGVWRFYQLIQKAP